MLIKIKQFLSISLLNVLLIVCLVGCSSKNIDSFSCIEPYHGYSYPRDQWTSGHPTPTISSPEISGWSLVLVDDRFDRYNKVISRGEDQIWILNSKGLFLYSKRYKTITDHLGSTSIPGYIFQSRDGVLWAFIPSTGNQESSIFRFSDVADTFVKVNETGNRSYIIQPIIGSVKEDSRGRLWILTSYSGLFLFDPKTSIIENEIPYKLDNSSVIQSFALDAQDNVWLGVGNLTPGLSDYIKVYNTSEKAFSYLPVGNDKEIPIYSILIDSERRLWIGDYAYWTIGTPLPKEGITGVHSIIRSPVFISERRPYQDYEWVRPYVLMEDSDGNIWYTSYGLVRFNPTTGEWCKVFDDDFPGTSVTEDSQGVFWTAVEGKLYMHE
jgi:ligand-binding sensor domain-containing protein